MCDYDCSDYTEGKLEGYDEGFEEGKLKAELDSETRLEFLKQELEELSHHIDYLETAKCAAQDAAVKMADLLQSALIVAECYRDAYHTGNTGVFLQSEFKASANHLMDNNKFDDKQRYSPNLFLYRATRPYYRDLIIAAYSGDEVKSVLSIIGTYSSELTITRIGLADSSMFKGPEILG